MNTNPFPSILAQGSPMHAFWFKTEANSALGRDTDNLYMFIYWVCVVSFLLVMGLMVAFVVRYRRRAPGARGGYQVSAHHNTPLELAWSIIPLLVMVVIFFWGFNGFVKKLTAPLNAEEIRVTGMQWNWAFAYSNGKEPGPKDFETIGNKKSPVMVVPVGRPVKLIMSSNDVIHSFFIRGMRTKMDVFPNRYTSLWFQADRPGEMHEVLCAEYCGQDHSEMAAWIRTVTEEEFQKWKAEEPDLPPVEMGRYLWRAKGCAACHTLDGTRSTGPTWKNLFGRAVEFADGTRYTAEQMSDPVFFANYVRESVLTPAARIVAGYPNQMNSFQGQITPKQLEAIIEFLKSSEMSDRSPAGAAPPTPAGTTAEPK